MSELNNKDMAVMEGTHDELMEVKNSGMVDMAGFQNPTFACYCSVKDDNTRESKVARYNAMSGADAKLSDHLKEPLDIVDIMAHPVTFTDTKTGEAIQSIRTVLIDVNGKRYQAVSGGVAASLQKIMAVFGPPHWDEPLTMIVDQETTRQGYKVMTISLA